MMDNSALEKLTEEFVQDRNKDNFVKIMEPEKAIVYVPTMMPENLMKNPRSR